MTGDLLTVREVAAILRVHPSTVRRLVWSGELSAIRVSQSLRIPVREVERLLAGEPTS